MTEFKKGDKVTVREGATSIGGQARDPKEVRTVQTVWDDGRVGLYPVHPAAPGNVFESEDLERRFPAPAEDHGTGDGSASDICAQPGCNCDLERRFPAPLDPAKVAVTLKGGDYIEAESAGAKIGGKVSHVTERGLVAIEHLGEFAIHHITAPSTRGGYRMFVLTAHQPAPEPDRVAFLHDYLTGRGDESLLDGLVVIDPAAVDVGALQRAINDAMPGHEASVALGHLGLNR